MHGPADAGKTTLMQEAFQHEGHNIALNIQGSLDLAAQPVCWFVTVGQNYYDAMKACQFKGMLQLEHIAPLMNAGPFGRLLG